MQHGMVLGERLRLVNVSRNTLAAELLDITLRH